MMQANQPYRVLLVDDDDTLRDVVAEMLRSLGYEVVSAEDGSEALSIFEDGDGIHIVVTDILMPAMDGWELAHRIKAIKPDIPIIALTGVSPNEVFPQLNAKSIGYALFKPLRMNDLKDTLQEIVDDVQSDS